MTEGSNLPETRLKGNILWFAPGMIAMGAVGAVSLMLFLQTQLKEAIQQPSVMTTLAGNAEFRAAVASQVNTLPSGALILFPGECPDPDRFEDLTNLLDGRYLYVSQKAVRQVELLNGTGSHTHGGGDHSHSVTGTTSRLGDGERIGTKARGAPHIDHKLTVTGTAQAGESAHHTHSGGSHEHARVAVRLCKVR